MAARSLDRVAGDVWGVTGIPWAGLVLLAVLALAALAPWILPGCTAVIGVTSARLDAAGIAGGPGCDAALVQTRWPTPWSASDAAVTSAEVHRTSGAGIPGLASACGAWKSRTAAPPVWVAILGIITILILPRFMVMGSAALASACLGASAGIIALLTVPALVIMEAGVLWWPAWAVLLAATCGAGLGIVGWWALRRSPGWDVRLGAIALGAIVLKATPSILPWEWWPLLGVGLLEPRIALVVSSAVLMCSIAGWTGAIPVGLTSAVYGTLLVLTIPRLRDDVMAMFAARRWSNAR